MEETRKAKRSKVEEEPEKVKEERTTPSTIFNYKHCHAQTLTISDQHVNILLTHSNEDDFNLDGKGEATVRSILKFSVIPFHRDVLGCNPVILPDIEEDIPTRTSIPYERRGEASDLILSLLKSYDFHLKSESGAEYSFYRGVPSPNINMQNLVCSILDKLSTMTISSSDSTNKEEKEKGNDKFESTSLTSATFGCFNVELISPASDRQIQRFMPSTGSSLIQETAMIYDAVTKPFIQHIVDGSSLGWIKNIIEGKKEKERILVDTPEYLLNIDTKWRTHPDPFTVPREEWFQHQSTEDLYCLGFIKKDGVANLRDLTMKHVPVLRAMLNEGCETIEKIYGVVKDQLRVFVHYQPQFYHFHVHFTRLENEIGAQTERAHLLSDIIQNLEMDTDYYKKRTITYKLQKKSPLYKQIVAFQEKNNE